MGAPTSTAEGTALAQQPDPISERFRALGFEVRTLYDPANPDAVDPGYQQAWLEGPVTRTTGVSPDKLSIIGGEAFTDAERAGKQLTTATVETLGAIAKGLGAVSVIRLPKQESGVRPVMAAGVDRDGTVFVATSTEPQGWRQQGTLVKNAQALGAKPRGESIIPSLLPQRNLWGIGWWRSGQRQEALTRFGATTATEREVAWSHYSEDALLGAIALLHPEFSYRLGGDNEQRVTMPNVRSVAAVLDPRARERLLHTAKMARAVGNVALQLKPKQSRYIFGHESPLYHALITMVPPDQREAIRTGTTRTTNLAELRGHMIRTALEQLPHKYPSVTEEDRNQPAHVIHVVRMLGAAMLSMGESGSQDLRTRISAILASPIDVPPIVDTRVQQPAKPSIGWGWVPFTPARKRYKQAMVVYDGAVDDFNARNHAYAQSKATHDYYQGVQDDLRANGAGMLGELISTYLRRYTHRRNEGTWYSRTNYDVLTLNRIVSTILQPSTLRSTYREVLSARAAEKQGIKDERAAEWREFRQQAAVSLRNGAARITRRGGGTETGTAPAALPHAETPAS